MAPKTAMNMKAMKTGTQQSHEHEGDGARARSRSRERAAQSSYISLPSTPTTPSDAGKVSDEEEFINLQFDCKLIMGVSGTILKSVSCNDRTCVGDIRHVVEEIVAGMHTDEVEIDYFKLLRGERVLLNDSNKIFEIFSNLDDCALTVVMLHKRKKTKVKAHVNKRAVTTAAFAHVISNEWLQPLHSSTPFPPQPSPPQ
jgi:hypothetical protein